jgi:hypothetical protein
MTDKFSLVFLQLLVALICMFICNINYDANLHNIYLTLIDTSLFQCVFIYTFVMLKNRMTIVDKLAYGSMILASMFFLIMIMVEVAMLIIYKTIDHFNNSLVEWTVGSLIFNSCMCMMHSYVRNDEYIEDNVYHHSIIVLMGSYNLRYQILGHLEVSHRPIVLLYSSLYYPCYLVAVNALGLIVYLFIRNMKRLM